MDKERESAAAHDDETREAMTTCLKAQTDTIKEKFNDVGLDSRQTEQTMLMSQAKSMM